MHKALNTPVNLVIKLQYHHYNVAALSGNQDKQEKKTAIERVFKPQYCVETTEKMYKGWLKAVGRTRNWAED